MIQIHADIDADESIYVLGAGNTLPVTIFRKEKKVVAKAYWNWDGTLNEVRTF